MDLRMHKKGHSFSAKPLFWGKILGWAFFWGHFLGLQNIGFAQKNVPATLSESVGHRAHMEALSSCVQQDTILPNLLGHCGAFFSWRHENTATARSIVLEYIPKNGIPSPIPPIAVVGGAWITEFFAVGVTEVRYIFTDKDDVKDTCAFLVTVFDQERPVLVCDTTLRIQLDGGECGRFLSVNPLRATDNCGIVDTVTVPASGEWWPIGRMDTVQLVVFDAIGFSDTCRIWVEVLEHIPSSAIMICKDTVQVSLPVSCTYKVRPENFLDGGDYRCFDGYSASVKDAQGIPIGTTLDSRHAGQLLVVTITDDLSGNSCWGVIRMEDKLAPKITCPDSAFIFCTQSEDDFSITGLPEFEDCSKTDIFNVDAYLQLGCDADIETTSLITRRWHARDKWGNVSSCLQTVRVLRGKLAQVEFPDDAKISCSDVVGSVPPDLSGWPSIQKIKLKGTCGLGVSFADDSISYCPGSYEIFRTWKIVDRCTASGTAEILEAIQKLTVFDEAPVIDLVNFGYDSTALCYTIPVNEIINGTCVASGDLPLALIDGRCNTIEDLRIFTPWGMVSNGGRIPYPGLALGRYPVSYIASDECGNITTLNIDVCVYDSTAPKARCVALDTVYLDSTGIAKVPASTFNANSSDNCGLLTFKARRLLDNSCDSALFFDDVVRFCPDDMFDSTFLVLRVYDRLTDLGKVDSLYEKPHSKDCLTRITVLDTLPPVCLPPDSVVVDCENFDPSLLQYGFATATDNALLDTILLVTDLSRFDTTCHSGTILRTFQAIDSAGLSSTCLQAIEVIHRQNYYFKFPDDLTVTECDTSGSYGTEPELFGKDCELIGISYTDEVFTVVPDACYKIERTWRINNWCTYDPALDSVVILRNGDGTGPFVSPHAPLSGHPHAASDSTYYLQFLSLLDTNGLFLTNCFTYKQIIKVIDGQKPVATFSSTSCDKTDNDTNFFNGNLFWDAQTNSHDLCEGPATLSIRATDFCSGKNIKIRYLLWLDMDGNNTYETVINSLDAPDVGLVFLGNANNPNYTGGTPAVFDARQIPANRRYRFGLKQDTIGKNVLASVAWKESRSYHEPAAGVSPELPYGQHKITWIVEDGCGNELIEEQEFVISDCKNPNVVCKNGLSINLPNVPGTQSTLYAADVVTYLEDNCTPRDLLAVGMCLMDNPLPADTCSGGLPMLPNGIPDSTVSLSCAHVSSPVRVQVWVRDLAGNEGSCTAEISVQDNMGHCNPTATASVTGAIQSNKNGFLQGFDGMDVFLDGNAPNAPQVLLHTMTDTAGHYGFMNNVPLQGSYALFPEKNDDYRNGIDVNDMLLIQKHILGTSRLTNPYRLIAADVNKSGDITALDIVELRKLLLGYYDQTGLPNNTSWRFVPREYVFSNPLQPFLDSFPEKITLQQVQQAITEGSFEAIKVGDLDQSALSLQSTQVGSRSPVTCFLKDRKVSLGEEFELELSLDDSTAAFQFGLQLSGVELLEISNKARLDAKDGIYAVEKNQVRLLSDAPNGLFMLKLRATNSGFLSEKIRILQEDFQAIAVLPNGTTQAISLAFTGENARKSSLPSNFCVFQNSPNPFTSATRIEFFLPDADAVSLEVCDQWGRILHTQEGVFSAGTHLFRVDASKIAASGLLFYTVTSSKNRVRLAMVLEKRR